MKFTQTDAELYVPDGLTVADALSRTTHLCIGAHPDDQEINAFHGIAACYRRPDQWFTGVCVTDGAGSARVGAYADYSDAEMGAIRRREQRQAAVLGEYAGEIQLAWPSSEVKNPASSTVTDELEAILRATRPEVLYLHNPADKHETHVACFARGLAAVRRLDPAERPAICHGFEGWRNLDWLDDAEKVPLPTDSRPHLFAALIGLFDSQIAGGKRYDLAGPARNLANATFFDSHAADGTSSLAWAMDLTPLLLDDSLDPVAFTVQKIDALRADVRERLQRVSS